MRGSVIKMTMRCCREDAHIIRLDQKQSDNLWHVQAVPSLGSGSIVSVLFVNVDVIRALKISLLILNIKYLVSGHYTSTRLYVVN